MNDENLLSCESVNAKIVIETFCDGCQASPLEVVSIEEAEELFFEWFPEKENGCCYFNENQIYNFINKLCEIAISRSLEDMVNEGIVELGHDGKDFVFSVKKDY